MESEKQNLDYNEILKQKQDYYGKTEASYEFAADKYSTLKMIQENESILEVAKLHSDTRMQIVLKNRIDELKKMI